MSPTLRRIPRTVQHYVEPLLTVEDDLPLQLVLIPGGTFTMGSPADEPEREDSEGPQHEVTVPAFFMSHHPITQAQYESLAETNPATAYDADRFVAPDKPVVGVSWEDAVAFCDRLANLTDRPYRLPSEAEWEYACRANTQTPFYFGDTLTDELANYHASATYGDGPAGNYRGETTQGAHFGIANAFGLSDMHGNVWEWCQDIWHNTYDGAPTDGSAWVTDGDSMYKILRGGSWSNLPRTCRSASRNFSIPDIHNTSFGFRVVCSAPRALQ